MIFIIGGRSSEGGGDRKTATSQALKLDSPLANQWPFAVSMYVPSVHCSRTSR